ncbi:hypothetical protein HNR65_002931 [Desulfosalsimonas propionicica]|uniref:Uncharacterized protein n=1 Tax=Desulfosalsimonas propionicica TaxID=332175 RepID=A0A7W0CBF1_9BACT|nr:hypothetical protein [Desulfosalsimonas propionicica]MBA2882579.1 hypothetical protein [Desulfosalsimonas propionicica]
MADTLKLFGQGTKVCVEIAVMATHQTGFFDLKIREIICKPRDF